ncbi:tRNA-splicing endonuclease positive effector (SEN1) [Heracleum sosnowskyi]|uniref:tRNA-splicing endonuclease positive effector (SEN1) n=1 Tax=Heracleum sosnowskyi TaxID=360622 RepID=A0AAD8MII5_9APIA|nr:tRNA-splicing endonuclease positive effector (SEN1) [Heracleum sosnowskyi]
MAVGKNKVEEEACSLRFYRRVLGWDYLRLLQESDQRNNHNNVRDLGLKKVKHTYKDVDEYISTYEPLLFEEVKAQIVQLKDQEEDEEWKTGMIVECKEVDGFHLLVVFGENWDSIQQNDLLLLSSNKLHNSESEDLPTIYAFGLVEYTIPGKFGIKIGLRMQLGGEIKGGLNVDEIKSCPRLLRMRPLVKESPETWAIKKVCSLSTTVREYVALHSIGSLPFKNIILKAAESQQCPRNRALDIPRSLEDYIKSNHNASQLEAIYAGLSCKPFVLIQGPPGTGKTQTIIGILSVILHAVPVKIHSKGKLTGIKHGRGPEQPFQDKYKHRKKASPWLGSTNDRDAIIPKNGNFGFFPTSGNELKPEVISSSRKYRIRVLVCAPSNSALDEIVLRVLKGIHDENDRAYTPKIVRIGLNVHHSVKTVSLDYLVEQKYASMDFQTGDGKKHGRDRNAIRDSILDEAAIVFSTLSFSGSSLFSKLNHTFDVVIIDEAAQAIEAATLVPLANGCKQVFLVGDPLQLPATVISPVADKFNYGMSLFKRFQEAGYPVQMLKTQYRMHPEIRSFPSKEFYKEALEDGPSVGIETTRAWHRYSCFGPFCFFDLHEGKESGTSSSGSRENVDEAEFVLLMCRKLLARFAELKSSSQIGIISPYRSQVRLLHNKFRDTFGEDSKNLVDINTVDGFQGREKDVAIFSCVRASKKKGIGFLDDSRRMNVGITRARSSVWVVGSASTLRKDKHWKNLIESAEQRNALYKVSKPYAEFFSNANIASMEIKKAVPELKEGPGYDIGTDMDIDVNVNDAEGFDEGGYAEGFDEGGDDD